jgi:hypothetical protein
MQKSIIDVYLADSSSMHRSESSTSGWYPSLMDLLVKETFKFQNDVLDDFAQ